MGVGEGEVSGRVRERYSDASMIGLDLPDPSLATHWRARGIAGMFADIARLPFPAASFDLVLAIEVLEHVPDPEAALAELARVGRGQLVLSVPREPIWRVANMARGKYIGALGNTPGHIQHWSSRGSPGWSAPTSRVDAVRAPFPWTMVAAHSRGPGG